MPAHLQTQQLQHFNGNATNFLLKFRSFSVVYLSLILGSFMLLVVFSLHHGSHAGGGLQSTELMVCLCLNVFVCPPARAT